MALSKILIVEDEPALREGLIDLLEGEGYSVEAVGDGEAALARGADPSIQLVLLDLMLPKLDGLGVCAGLREVRPKLPILMLTARGAEEDKVRGLKSGADDYITKPFGTRELLARIEAIARRLEDHADPLQQIQAGELAIDLGRCEARRRDQVQRLTAREVSILRWLYQHRSRAVTRAELLEVVWDARGDLQTRTVDMTIANLRQKIEVNPKHPEIVVTVKGVGYAWGTQLT